MHLTVEDHGAVVKVMVLHCGGGIELSQDRAAPVLKHTHSNGREGGGVWGGEEVYTNNLACRARHKLSAPPLHHTF